MLEVAEVKEIPWGSAVRGRNVGIQWGSPSEKRQGPLSSQAGHHATRPRDFQSIQTGDTGPLTTQHMVMSDDPSVPRLGWALCSPQLINPCPCPYESGSHDSLASEKGIMKCHSAGTWQSCRNHILIDHSASCLPPSEECRP